MTRFDWIHRIRAAALAMACLALAPAVQGQTTLQCTMQTSPATIWFNDVSVARDVAAGTPLSEVVSTSTSVNCPANPGPTNNGFLLQYYPAVPVSSVVPDVWETGLPGIGVRVLNVDYNNRDLSRVGSGSWGAFAPDITSASPFTGSYTFTYQLIKTGQATTTGTVVVPHMFTLVSHNVPANVTSPPLSQVGIGNTTVTARSCSVSTPSIAVTLPTVVRSLLSPVGATAGETGFQIGLTCDVGATVYVTLSDATTPGNRTDQLTLTSGSTARGVQLRITRPTGESISFGPDSALAGTVNQILVGPSDSTSAIPLRVRYISTGEVTPGTVNALATFTMSYQ
ncbi:fimbrial protein [Cupriavidus agavae]|nr:fimbrial protein [Cupriavidus agavae]